MESAEKNAENTKLLHIRNSIAWSCFFREIWVELGGGFVRAWWESRERDGLDCFRCRAALQKRGNCISGSGASPDGTDHYEWWRDTGERGLYGNYCDRTSSDVSHHSIDGISEGLDGTSQRLCAQIALCTAQIKTKAFWGMWGHIVAQIAWEICKMSIC